MLRRSTQISQPTPRHNSRALSESSRGLRDAPQRRLSRATVIRSGVSSLTSCRSCVVRFRATSYVFVARALFQCSSCKGSKHASIIDETRHAGASRSVGRGRQRPRDQCATARRATLTVMCASLEGALCVRFRVPGTAVRG